MTHIRRRKEPTSALAVAVIQRGEATYAEGFGRTGIDDYALPTTPDTLFSVGSVSKAFTAILVMRLVDRGLLRLDTPVGRYVPWLRFSEPTAEDTITLRHLLSHTSGLPSAYTDYGSRDPQSLEHYIRQEVAALRFIAPPGRVHFYSNAGIDLAGYIAEAVSGVYFPILVQKEVFAPLAMDRSTYDRNVAITYPLALPLERARNGRLRVQHRLVDNPSGNPAGFALSTVRDLSNLALMLLKEGRFRRRPFLSQDAVREMLRPQADVHNIFNKRKSGLTFYVDQRYRGKRIITHGGWMMSYACRFVLLPDEGGAVVAVTNWREEFWPLVNGVIDRVFHLRDSDPSPKPSAAERGHWPGYAGEYVNVEEGMVAITIQNDRLMLRRIGGHPIPLKPVGDGAYLADDAGVAFVPNSGGAEFVIVDEQPFRRVQRDRNLRVSTERLGYYSGIYSSYAPFEGDHYPIEFQVRGGRLYARQGGKRIPCIPLSENRFVSEWGVVEFEGGNVRLYDSVLKQKG